MTAFKPGDRVRFDPDGWVVEYAYDSVARVVNGDASLYIALSRLKRVVPPMPDMPPGTTLRWRTGSASQPTRTLVLVGDEWREVGRGDLMALDVAREWAAGRIDPDSVRLPAGSES